MQTDIQEEGFIGHEFLVLNFVPVADCQLTLFLADELTDNGYLAILVFLFENVEFADFKRISIP